MRAWILVVAAAALACPACGDGSDGAAEAPVVPAPPVPEKPCADGFEVLAGDAGCAPVRPTAACTPGTRAALGSTACVPVGTTVCAPGFITDPSGWGCDVVVAPVACASGSGTRERFGSTACTPVSDCNAPFPPAGATVFVDAAFTDGQLDATHVRTITEGVTAAPAGATVAVESGTYVEKIALTKRAITIAGRCAEKVIVKQTDAVIGSGMDIETGHVVTLKNLTFRGFRSAIAIEGGKTKIDSVILEDGLNAGVTAANDGTEVSLTNVVIRGMKVKPGAQQAFGLYATFGSHVVVDDSVFSSNEFINVGSTKIATKLTVSRSIIRDGKSFGPAASYGLGVYVGDSGSATIEESAILDNSTDGIDIFSSPGDTSTGILRRSIVRGTKVAAGIGRGVEVTGSQMLIEESTVRGNALTELLVSAGATLDIRSSTLLGLPPKDAKDRGVLGLVTESGTTKASSLAIVQSRSGVLVQRTGRVEMDGSLVQATRPSEVVYEDSNWIGLGIFVESKASLLLTKSTLQDTRTVGVIVTGKAEINDSLIQGTRAGLDGFGGRGLSVQNGGNATVARSAFVDNVETGVVTMLKGSTLTMTASTVQDTNVDPQGEYGIGVLVGDDAFATIDACTITGSKSIGVAVAVAGATMTKSTVSRNAVGVHAQGGTALQEGDGEGDGRILLVSPTTRFVENGTRVGSGIVPLPTEVIGPRSR